MDLGIAGRAALITGASRGLGRATALAFADEGVDVGVCGRDAGKLREVQAAVEERGVRCVAVPADLGEPGACERTVDEVAGVLGRLDFVVNNASTNADGTSRIRTTSPDDLVSRLTGKVMWAIRCSKAALPHMQQGGGGRIVMIGGSSLRSTLRRGSAATIAGSTSAMGNAALSAFAKYLGEEVVGDNILVNVIHPGSVRTDRFASRLQARAEQDGTSLEQAEAALYAELPLGRMVVPDEIAALVVFLCSERGGAISGQAISVDGGSIPSILY